jgi:hypothetical protein
MASRRGGLLVFLFGKPIADVFNHRHEHDGYRTHDAAEEQHLEDVGAEVGQLIHAQILPQRLCRDRKETAEFRRRFPGTIKMGRGGRC